MKRELAKALLVLMLSVPALAQANDDPKAEESVKQTVQDWIKAQAANDAAALSRVLGDDFIGTTTTGAILSKRDLLPNDDGGTNPMWENARVDKLRVRLFGETAIVNGVVLLDAEGKTSFQFTETFVRRDGRWQMIAAHLSRPCAA